MAVANQQRAIREEYRQQAPRWGKMQISEHLAWVVAQMPLSLSCDVLDVAAGTGLFGRAVAPLVRRVTAIDITPEMIEAGRLRAQRDGITNMVWQLGAAEKLPFPAGSFDLAITRYSIHHLVDPAALLAEMGRVCRPTGTLVAVDIVSDEDPAIAARQDALEAAMDRTHTSVLSPSRLVAAAAGCGLTLRCFLSRDVAMNFEQWQAHVPTDAEARAGVRRALEAELAGGERTGMRPFRRDGVLYFTHVWGVLMAGKGHRGMS
jgi:ubiquinone/menaquinone biosynthesis C-methylase UbiE